MSEPKLRTGCEFIYQLQDGEQWAMHGGMIVVVHPDRPAKIVHPPGKAGEINYRPISLMFNKTVIGPD